MVGMGLLWGKKGDVDKGDAWFQKALTADPESEAIQHNYRWFEQTYKRGGQQKQQQRQQQQPQSQSQSKPKQDQSKHQDSATKKKKKKKKVKI